MDTDAIDRMPLSDLRHLLSALVDEYLGFEQGALDRCHTMGLTRCVWEHQWPSPQGGHGRLNRPLRRKAIGTGSFSGKDVTLVALF